MTKIQPHIRQAVILAGGVGSRLQKTTGNQPKILTQLVDDDVLQFQIKQFCENGFTRLLYLLGYKSESVVAQLKKLKKKFPIDIDFIVEELPLGTGGAILHAFQTGKLDDYFLLVHGDIIFRTNIHNLVDEHFRLESDVTLLIHPSSHFLDSDIVEVNKMNRVRRIHTKPHDKYPKIRNMCNAGIYLFSSAAISSIEDFVFDLDRDLIPTLIRRGYKVNAVRNVGFVKDMGTPTRLESVRKTLKRDSYWIFDKAVFLDRDGTLNLESGYLTKPEEVYLFDDAIRLVKRCNESGIRVIVISNQPVISRGEANYEDVDAIHARIDEILGNHGAYIDEYFFCPHHPDRGFLGEVPHLKILCSCRKPEIGLVLQACTYFGIDLAKCIVVGDSWRDFELARRLNLNVFLIERNISKPMLPVVNTLDDVAFENFENTQNKI